VVERVLLAGGVRIVHDAATAVTATDVQTQSQGVEPYDVLVHAFGLEPSRLVRATGLPTDYAGALVVDEHLRSVADPRGFGGGDGIAFQGQPLPRAIAYAVRQAPILCHNVLATLDGRPLRAYRPQRRSLLILNLGDGTGLAVRGRRYWHGR